MSCQICERTIDEGVYCWRHALAYKNLEEGFENWRYALGITWVEYLEKVGRISGSGRWVRDVVEDILRARGSLIQQC
jgi:hypothetical protein